MDDTESRMREVLLQLALTSNGRTASFDVAGSSEPDWTPSLTFGDAPHEYYAAWWERCESDSERELCLDAARHELHEVRHSRGDRRVQESKSERDKRIVDGFEGIEAGEVAIRVRCGVRDVWSARDAAGRDRDFGRKPRAGPHLSTVDRRAEVDRLAAEGMSARQIAFALGVHYDTVRRDLGRKISPP